MQHIETSDLNDLRDELEVEQHTLVEELESRGKSIGGDWQGASKLEGEEADPVDAADQIEELVTNVPLVEELEKRKREVDAAIIRMDKDTYGICGVCNEEIPFELLQANPAAATCIKHAGK